MTNRQNRRACSECPGTYELVPPGDSEYTEPKQRPSSEDNIKCIYECDRDQHWNTIYWHKKEFGVVTSKLKV